MDTTGLKRIRKNEYQNKRRAYIKCKLVAHLGGQCERCKRVYHPQVFDVHHRDPKFKESRLSGNILSGRTWAYIQEEAKKCHLLCSNCHREVHLFDDHRFLDHPEDKSCQKH